MSLAYKYVATFMMLCEVNRCSHRLNLPVPVPVAEENLTFKYVTSPRLRREGGALDTKRYSFSFSNRGVLCYVTWLHPFGNEPLLPLHLQQANMKSLLDKDQALELARGWLTAMDVSVPDLERAAKPTVEQRFFYPDATPTGSVSNLQKVLLPIFDVTWTAEGDRRPGVEISIYGPTKELLYLRQEDDSFSRRPEHPVRDIEGLLAIPDAEFLKYSQAELEELLIRHANTNIDITPLLVSSDGKHTNILMQFPLKRRSTNAPSPRRK
jgi:hypothetical protein